MSKKPAAKWALVSAITFRHGNLQTPWWGVTVQCESVVRKVRFSTVAAARKWCKDLGIGRVSFTTTETDPYNTFGTTIG
jgi:hypothetical protein